MGCECGYYNFDCYEFVDNELTIKEFFEHTMGGEYALKDGEFWFIAASARNKELTEEERKDIGISNLEMYKHEFVEHPSVEAYLQRVFRFETREDGYVSHLGRKPFPPKCLTLYATINPISTKKAFMCRLKEMNDVFDLMMNSENASNEHVMNLMRRCIKSSNKVATKAVSRKNWMDIDIDFTPSFMPNMSINRTHQKVMDELKFKVQQAIVESKMDDRKYILVHTKGGCHVLFPTKDLNKNPQIFLNSLRTHLGEVSKEIVFCDGGVPLPGTYQRDYPVTFSVLPYEKKVVW